MLECLQKVPLEVLVSKADIFEKFLWTPNPWKPVVDNEYSKRPFLPLDPMEAYREGKFHQVWEQLYY